MLLYGKLVLQHTASRYARRMKIWVRATRRKKSLGGRVMNRLWRIARGIRPIRP